MARPKEFDVDAALETAQHVFWEKGFEATTTDDLCRAMGIGRQSFYDSFGGKHDVFIRALTKYCDDRFTATMETVEREAAPIAALEKLLYAVADETDSERRRGCFGVSTMCELGTSDADAQAVGALATKRLVHALTELLRAAKRQKQVRADLSEADAAAQMHATVVGMRVLAKGGAKRDMLRAIAKSTLAGLAG